VIRLAPITRHQADRYPKLTRAPPPEVIAMRRAAARDALLFWAGVPAGGGVERLSAPRRSLQQSEQLGERAEGFLRNGLDLLLGDRIQTEFVHLPAALALSEDLPPRSGRRRRLVSQNLLGAGVHAPAAFRVPCRITGRYPPAMHEVVQHAEIEVHPNLVKHRLKPSVERLTVLAYHQSGPDGAQALGRIGRPSREEVVRLRGHLGLPS